MRLQRILALAGFGSRRKCEELITEGRVDVDKETVMQLGTTANPDTQKIFVDGQRVKLERKQYFVLNKPAGVISTSNDPTGRARVIDLIKTQQRVFTVGRLDKSSEGLILVTNDGDLANQLTHPKFGIAKVYHVNVSGSPSPEHLRMLKQGVYLADGFAQVQHVKIRKRRKNVSELEIVLDEGRNREIRRLLAKIGHKVLRLKRVAIGPLKLGTLPTGAHRELTRDEVKALQRATEAEPRPKRVRAKSESTDSRTDGRKSAPKRRTPSSASGTNASASGNRSSRSSSAKPARSRSNESSSSRKSKPVGKSSARKGTTRKKTEGRTESPGGRRSRGSVNASGSTTRKSKASRSKPARGKSAGSGKVPVRKKRSTKRR